MPTLTMQDIRLGDTVRLRNGELVVVDGVYESYGDRDGTYPGPWVKGSAWSERYLLADVTEIVVSNPRSCRFCGNGVTATNPDTDFCRICHYTGRAEQDRIADRIARVERLLPDGWSAGVEHTGGGCFWLAVRHQEDPFYYAITAHDAVLPEGDEEWSWAFRYHENEDHEDYEGVVIIQAPEQATILTDEQVAKAIVDDIASRS